MEQCPCPREQRCEACVARAIRELGGSAQLRGDRWAESVARRRPELRGTPWPAYEDRTAELARAKVVDLAVDPRVIDLLARACHMRARIEWERWSWQWAVPQTPEQLEYTRVAGRRAAAYARERRGMLRAEAMGVTPPGWKRRRER